MRAPVPDGSLTDLVVLLGSEVSADEVNARYREAGRHGPARRDPPLLGRADRLLRHRRRLVLVHLRQRADDGARSAWSRCSAGTTTSGATARRLVDLVRAVVVHRPRSVEDADVAGKRALVRVDFNVPLEDGRVADDTRIRAALPTIRLLLDRGAAEVVLMSHLGRPKGPDPAFAMKPVEQRLRELLPDERIRLLENTRFDPRETANDPEYAQELAAHGDLFVNDAFGSAHRAHASTVGVAHLLPAYAGLLLLRELEELGALLDGPESPFVAVLGGAKVADKIGVLTALAERADTLLIGGKMAEEVDARRRLRAPGGRRRRRGVRAGRRVAGRPVGRGAGRLARPRHRPGHARALRGADRGGAHRLLERADGRLRVATLCRGDERRRPGGRSWPTRTPSSAAATRCARSRSSASPSGSTGSRPAAAPRSSCWRARSFRASPRSRRHEHRHTLGTLSRTTRAEFLDRLEPVGGPRRPRVKGTCPC